jgi:hypothetical protein
LSALPKGRAASGMVVKVPVIGATGIMPSDRISSKHKTAADIALVVIGKVCMYVSMYVCKYIYNLKTHIQPKPSLPNLDESRKTLSILLKPLFLQLYDLTHADLHSCIQVHDESDHQKGCL